MIEVYIEADGRELEPEVGEETGIWEMNTGMRVLWADLFSSMKHCIHHSTYKQG